MNKLLISMAFSLLSLFSCKSSHSFTSMQTEEFATYIQNDKVQRLDVRTAEEYSAGHIPSSINIDVLADGFAEKADSLLNKKRPVALYCRSGKRSKKAADILAKKGYKIYELDKGFISWEEIRLPTTF